MRRSPSPQQLRKRVKREMSAKNTNSMLAVASRLQERELPFDREQWLRCQLEDHPLSVPKLPCPLPFSENHSNDPTQASSLQPRSKAFQKSTVRASEEEQRMISRENMELLGLTIQKISYSTKGQPSKKPQGACSVAHGLTPEVLLGSHLETIPRFTPLALAQSNPKQQGGSRPRPSTVRKKSRSAQSERRRSVRTINPEYLNPVYEARFASYRQLLFRMHWTYGVYVGMDAEGERRAERRLKAWVGPGNNSALLKELIRRRHWWTLADERTSQAQFVWTQLKVPELFQKQQTGRLWASGQVRAREQSTDKVETRVSTRRRSRNEKALDPEETHLKKIMTGEQEREFKKATQGMEQKELFERQCRLNLRELRPGEDTRVHNHFPNNFYLGNKKALYYSLKEYYELTGGDLFSVIPLTFHIRHPTKDPQLKRFEAYHRKREAVVRRQQRQREEGAQVGRPLRNIWIVKPGEATNRGNGITVIDEVYELNSILRGSSGRHDNGSERTFIVQLYIDRPLLYRGRKFDIRHFVMVSQLHGAMRAYWYSQGYIRTSSYDFDVADLDRDVHLTNDAVQKQTPLYGKYEPANKLSYAEFQKYLDATHPTKNYSLQRHILGPMKTITTATIRSVFVKLSPQRLEHNFEIFGLDFMVDSDFRPWLIEVNTNPCLETSCPLLARIVPSMLDQALRLTLDVVVPPPGHYPNTAKHLVPQASLETLNYELIFDQRVEGPELRAIYRRSKSNLLERIGSIEEEEVFSELGGDSPVPLLT